VRLAFLLLCLFLSGCLADLRPDGLVGRAEATCAAEGRALLETAYRNQHGEGATPWAEQAGVEVALTDEFFGLSGLVNRPWPEDPQRLVYRFKPGADAGVVVLEGGERWGLHEWNVWKQQPDGLPEYGDHADVMFWVPTVEYFLEAAFRLREAAIVDRASPVDLDGERHQRVYATWVSYEPNAVVDQFVAYVSEAGLLTRLDFTARDAAKFATGTARYSDHRRVGAYLLPHTIEIEVSPTGGLLHRYVVEEWKPGVDVPRKEYAPDSDRAPRQKPS
jgi:hypothetical protein